MNVEIIKTIVLVLGIISGSFLSFVGGYFLGKYKEGELTQKWFEKTLELKRQLADIMTEKEDSNTKSEDDLEEERWLISAACDRVNCDKTKCNNCVNHNYCDYEP